MTQGIRPREILRRRKRRLQTVTLMLLLAAIVSGFWFWYRVHGWVTTDDAFVAGHVISVKAQTDGTVIELLTENTRYVDKGQVLVRLDANPTAVALQQAEAELADTVRGIVALRARADTLTQRMTSREAALNAVRHDWQRFSAAARDGAASAQQVDNAHDKLIELEAGIRETQAELRGVEAQLGTQAIAQHPSVEKAKAKLRLAFLAHMRRDIVAPVSGYVAKRKVQVGDRVNTGTPLLNIIPLDDVWVEANVLETQMADIRPGQRAEVRVDAYGDDRVYQGIVQGLNPATGSTFALLPTDNATGNFIHIAERVQVRIALDRDAVKAQPLQPGLSTLTRIRIDEAAADAPAFDLDHGAYRTDIYDNELDGAERIIATVLKDNGGL